MNKHILFLGCAALMFASCKNDITDICEYENPGSAAYNDNLPMYTGGAQMDDYYVNVSAWENRAQWNLANVHDPSVMLASDGYYYMYQTDASYGNAHAGYGQGRGHFYCRRSKDLVNWQFMGPTMHGMPGWVEVKVNEYRANLGLSPINYNFRSQDNFGYWAPCVRKVNDNLYRMYYSFNMPSVDGKVNANKTPLIDSLNVCPNMMGLMETSTPWDIDSWVDKGFVITQYSDMEKKFNMASGYGGYYKYNVIDPSYIITSSGEHWLIYGSWHSGIAAVKIDPSTGKTFNELPPAYGAANESAYGKKIYTRNASNSRGTQSPRDNKRWQASEGPEIVYHGGYYYLFLANNGLSADPDNGVTHAPYCTTVVRSKTIDGPYYDITGTDFVTGSNGTCAYPIVTHPYKFSDADHDWEGISHCAVWNDGTDNNWFYCSQQRYENGYSGNTASGAIMMGGIRRIVWVEDPTGAGGTWPLVLPERYANVEQTAITENDLVGNWLNIDLVYKYAGIDNSVSLSLTSDHKVNGNPFNGQTWSFDASKNILTVGNVKLTLRRELDWEMKAGQRKPTIVYVGLSEDGKTTYWGKKVQ